MEEYPFIVDDVSLRAFFRFEITYAEMTEGRENILFDDCRITLEDYKIAMDNLKEAQICRKDFCEEWYEHVFIHLKDEFGIRYNSYSIGFGLPVYNNEKEITDAICFWCKEQYDKYLDKEGDNEIPNYTECLRSISFYKSNTDLPVEKRKFTTLMKRYSVRSLGSTSNINSAPLERRNLFKRFVNELCKVSDFYGVRAKGFSYLFGNVCFKKDIQAAKKLFLDLYQTDEDTRLAGLLGDIYYGYFDDVPDYTKAFMYYTVSGLDGNTDALLKVAEMLAEGRGTVKNEKVARATVMNLYDQTYSEFCKGMFACSLPEVARTIGNFCARGIAGKADAMEAFKYLNIAKYALNRRMTECGMMTDSSLMEEIRLLYDALALEVGTNPNASQVISEVPNLFLTALTDSYKVEVEVRPFKKEFKLISRRLRKEGEEVPSGIFVDFPLIEYATLTDEVTEYFPKNSKVMIKGNKTRFIADEMVYDTKEKVCIFKNAGIVVAKIKTGMYVARVR